MLHCWHCLCSDSHVKGLYYTLRCFMMDLWEHAQGECAASSDAALQTQLELTSLQVRGWPLFEGVGVQLRQLQQHSTGSEQAWALGRNAVAGSRSSGGAAA